MDNMRLILILAIGFVAMMLMQQWEQDYGVQETVVAEDTSSAPSPSEDSEDVPETPVFKGSNVDTPVSQENTITSVKTIQINTDVLQLNIDLAGGTVISTDLLAYPVSLDEPDNPLRLMDQSSDLYYVLKGGLVSKQAAPNHQASYTTDSDSYQLDPNEDELSVDLYWQSAGLEVVKRFRFKRGAYDFDIEYLVDNQSMDQWQARAYGQIQRSEPESSGNRFIYTYTGAVVSAPEKRYEKVSFDDMEENDLEEQIQNGWAAMLQHYFLSVLIPTDKDKEHYFYSKALKSEGRYIIGMMTPVTRVASGEQAVLSHRVYIGPKIQEDMAKVAPELDLTVDYGIFWFLAKPLYLTLDFLYSMIGNWGWSILLVTLLLKLMFYPLSEAGYRSMANMRKVQPRMLALRERYKDDKQRLNQAMMEMYKTEKINPLGGCFPILIQIPVFISLYWVLLESVELRQAPFILWIQDLSTPDPYFILPLIMGITMFIQQRLNPAPMDPMQKKVMSFLPVVFTVFFAFFPSGLVLYWVANNVLSILQQARINKNLEKAGLK